jgi:hypothetical protein
MYHFFRALAKNSSFIFLALALCGWKKINVLFVRLAFLVQMLNFRTIFCIMHNVLQVALVATLTNKPD